jgi:hypothetical protein
VKWQPEPDQSWPESPGGDHGYLAPGIAPDALLPGGPLQAPPQGPPPPAGRLRRLIRQVAFGMVLTIGLAGLALSAVGIAHQLLPRRFTPAQRRAISAWEMDRRWRALPAGTIFPASVPYAVPADALDSASNLVLDASRLGISPATRCTSAASGAASRVLSEHGCSAALRATYADSSGSMVATVTVAVLPSASAARAVASELAAPGAGRMVVRVLRIARTQAAGFDADDRQLSSTSAAGSYVILVTAGFSDGRHHLHMADRYVDAEMVSLMSGLAHAASARLAAPLPVPSCPGTPGC